MPKFAYYIGLHNTFDTVFCCEFLTVIPNIRGISCPPFAYYFLKESDAMQRGRVLSLRRFGIADFLQKNYFLLLIFLCLIIGLILGVFLFSDIDFLKTYSEEYVKDYFDKRQNVSFGMIFLTSSLESLALLFIAFLLGASFFGVVTVPLAIAIKGFFQGGITAFLYSSYGLKGIVFNAIIYIPSTIIFIIVLMLASRESVRFSMKISSLTLSKTLPCNLSEDFKIYSIKYLFFAVFVLISSLLDSVLSITILKHFVFL